MRLLPPLLVLILFAFMAGATLVAPLASWPPGLWRLLGAPFVVAGLGLAVAGSRRFDRVGTNIKTFDDPDILVTDGLFGPTRNPMYLGFLLSLIGAALGLGAASTLAGPVVFFVAADRWYIPFEEERMVAVFGERFVAYRRATPRWIKARP